MLSLQEPDYLDLNKPNGKLHRKNSVSDDAKSDSNVQLHQPIEIVRPASTDGPPVSTVNYLTGVYRPRLTIITHPPTALPRLPTPPSTIRRLEQPPFAHELPLPRIPQRTPTTTTKRPLPNLPPPHRLSRHHSPTLPSPNLPLPRPSKIPSRHRKSRRTRLPPRRPNPYSRPR